MEAPRVSGNRNKLSNPGVHTKTPPDPFTAGRLWPGRTLQPPGETTDHENG